MVPPPPIVGPFQIYAQLKAELEELDRVEREIREQRALVQVRLGI